MVILLRMDVAIAGDAAELGVLVERIAAGGVTNQREKVFVAQIVNPWPWGLRVCNDILAVLVVEVTVTFLLFHYFDCFLSLLLAKLRTYSDTTKSFSE